MITCSCFICEFIFFVGFLIVFITTIIIQTKFDLIDSQYIILLKKNWMTSPIVDIQNIGNSSNCSISGDNTTSVLIFDYWLGTVAGCTCSGEVNTGSCSTSCSKVLPYSSLSYKFWRSNQFCVKRMPSFNSYLGLTILKPKSLCPSTQVNCGIIDSLGNILCMPSIKNCPINDIQILNVKDKVPLGYKNISLNSYGENKTLVFGNKGATGKIAIEFKISENTPCMNPYFSNNLFSYILDSTYNKDKCLGSLGDLFLDKNYEFIDSSLKYNVYKDNSILNITNLLPFYKTAQLSQLQMRLYYSNYIGITCVDSIKAANTIQNITEGFNSIQLNFTTYKNFFLAIFIYSIIIWCLALVIFHLIRGICCNVINDDYDDDMDKCCYKFKLLTELFIFIIFLPIMILNVSFYIQIKSLREANAVFYGYISCGDNSFNEAVHLFFNKLDNILVLSQINLYVSIIIFLIPLTFYFCCFGKCCNCDSSIENLESVKKIEIIPPDSNKYKTVKDAPPSNVNQENELSSISSNNKVEQINKINNNNEIINENNNLIKDNPNSNNNFQIQNNIGGFNNDNFQVQQQKYYPGNQEYNFDI